MNQVEDRVLGRQEGHAIDNYTLAVTFVDKVYRSPKKKISLRQILMVAIPAVILVGGIGIALYLRHRNTAIKQESLERAMESGETYLQYDNYEKAAQEYQAALDLAEELGRDSEAEEADQYLKLAEQVRLADQAMGEEEYQKAQELFLTARELSREAGNVGKQYIDSRLEETRDYMEVYDLIELGMAKEESGNLEGASRAYREARELAASIYFGPGKEEAMSRQAQVEEQLDEEAAQAEEEAAEELAEQTVQQELENQQKINDQKNAIDLENQGNELLAQGQYESAVTYYRTAKSIYGRLELPDMAAGLDEKIAAAQAGQAAAAAAAGQAVPGAG